MESQRVGNNCATEQQQDFFSQLYEIANHLSEVSPIIIAKEKPKHDELSGGSLLLWKAENEADPFLPPVSSLHKMAQMQL